MRTCINVQSHIICMRFRFQIGVLQRSDSGSIWTLFFTRLSLVVNMNKEN
jgi:hypothetical protein